MIVGKNCRNSLRDNLSAIKKQYLPLSVPVLRVQVALRTCLEKFHFCFASTTDVVLDSRHMQEDE